MNTNKMVLRAAVAVALGSMPFIAQATIYGPSKPITLAKEIDATGKTVPFTGTTYALTLPNTLTSAKIDPGTGVSVIIRMTLTNGATFDSTITKGSLACQYATAVMESAIYSEIQNGSAVFFRLASGILNASTSYCSFSGGVTLNSGNREDGYGMIVSSIFDANGLGDNRSDVNSGSIVTFADAFSFVVTPPTKDVTIDVAKPSLSQNFASGRMTAVLGNIAYKSLGSSTAYVITAAISPATVSSILGSVTLTLSGAPLMSRGMVSFTASAAACPANTTGTTASTSGVVSITIPSDTVNGFGSVGATGLTLCYLVDGATKIEKGSITFANPLTVVGAGGATPNASVASSDNVLVKLTKNGTSVKILNIPSPAEAATGNSVNVRVYNMGSTEAEVIGTLYETDPNNVAGKVTPNVSLGVVAPKAVMVLKPDTLVTKFGKTWAGRAWLQLEGGSKDLRVMALMSTNGVLVNMSDRVVEDDGKGCRGGGDC